MDSSRGTMLHVAVLLLLAPFVRAISLDLCDSQSVTSANVTEYRYKNQPVQNCNCTSKTSCIRKCCAVGFYAKRGVCTRYEDPDFVLDIPVYNEKTLVRHVSGDSEILAGVMNCPFFPFIPNGTDWFYMQEDGRILTSQYGVLSNDYYCVDDINRKGLSAFICYDRGGAESTSRKIYAAGIMMIFTLSIQDCFEM